MPYAWKTAKWIPSLVAASLLCVQCGQNPSPPPVAGSTAQKGANTSQINTNAGQSGYSTSQIGTTNSSGDQFPMIAPLTASGSTPSSVISPVNTSTGTTNSSVAAASPSQGNSDGTGCIGADDFTCKAEAALVQYTNQIRAKVGKSPLVQDFRLSFVARDWSKQQGAFISHTGFPNARASVFQQNFPSVTTPSISAENVALNGGGTDPDAVGKAFADQWEGSPGHYANIVGDHNFIGVGISCTDSGSTTKSTDSGLAGWISSLFAGFSGGQCTGTQIFAD